MPPSAAGPGSPSAPREAKVRTPEEIEARREKSRAKHAAYRAEGKPSHRLTVAERKARTAARTGQPVPAAKKGAPEKLSVPRIAEALAKTGGLIGPAAEFLQYPRSSVVHYVERYASLQRVQSQAKEHALDDTEWALIKAARAGEPWAVQWFLKYQGKARGYQEVHKSEQDTRVQVEVTYTEDALGAGRPNTTVQQLPPPAQEPSASSADAASPQIEIVEAEITYPQGGGGMTATRLVLPSYHDGQKEVSGSKARFIVCACGRRRFGKSTLAVRKVAETALAGHATAWGGPTYKSVGEIWRLFCDLLRPVTSRRSEQEKRLELVTGGYIDVWSLEEPDNVRGRGYTRFVVDEAAAISRLEYAWQQVIRPTLTDHLGDCWFLSTPKGRNYFWELYRLGMDPSEEEWASFRFPSERNPYLPATEIAAAKRSLPARVFAQEYEADFVSEDIGVFRRVEEAARAPGAVAQERAIPGHVYVAGLDFGRFNDFTVVTILDVSKTPVELVAMDRFNQTDWQTQWTRIQGMHTKFRPVAFLAEKNSAGEPVIAVLRMIGLPVVEFVTSNPSKALAIQALALAFEQEQLRILDDPVLLGELQAFEAERLPSGMIRYAAPENRHDDCVMSLALGWLAASQSLNTPTRTSIAFGPGPARGRSSLPDLSGAIAN